jgi:hypothetical protein
MKKIIYLLNLFVLSVNATTLEEQYPNFFVCKTDTYIDRITGAVHGKYFSERRLLPCKQADSVAEFCIKDTFYSLPVTKIVVPDPFPVVAFYIDLPFNKVREILKNKVNYTFKDGGSDIKPTITSDGKNKSILMCDPGEQ